MSETESSKGDVGQFVPFVHLFIKEVMFTTIFYLSKKFVTSLFFFNFFFIHETKLNIHSCELQ